MQLRENVIGYAMLVPSLLLFAVFLFYPLGKSMYLSLHLTDPRGRIAAYVGFENFTALLTSDAFWNSLRVTGLFTLYTVIPGLVLGLVLAALTSRPRRGMRAFQLVFSMPVALSIGTAAVIWMMLFHPTMGMLNYWLSLAGLAPIQWLTDPKWALISISIMTVWMNSGFNYIMLHSGLQSIREDILESATIDGAGPVTLFVRIKLPLLSPVLFFLTVVSIMHAFQSFGQSHILTKGGPAGSTEVFVYSIYKEAFVNYQLGTGSAMSLVLFMLLLILTLIQFLVLEKKVHYQ